LVLLVSGAALGWATYRWGRPIARRVSLMYGQRQCLTYRAPPDRVVFDSNLPGGGDVRHRLAQPWEAMYERLFPGSRAKYSKPVATLFVGRRASPLGEHRLVVVELRDRSGDKDGASYAIEAFRLGTWTTDALCPWSIYEGDPASRLKRMDYDPRVTFGRLVYYAGQPDANDPSHATIRYTIDGFENFIDVWLVDSSPEEQARSKDTVSVDAYVRWETGVPQRTWDRKLENWDAAAKFITR
jgi:hypothetical protein